MPFLPALLTLVLTRAPAGVKVEADPIHATEIIPTKRQAMEVIKQTNTIKNVLDAAIAQPPPSTPSSLTNIWASFRITALFKTSSPTNVPSPLQHFVVTDLVVPIIALLFIQMLASEMQARDRSGNAKGQILPKGFAQRALMPINTSLTNNSQDVTGFASSIDSGFQDGEQIEQKLPFYEHDSMVPDAVDLVPDQCEIQDNAAYQELLRQLVLGVLQYLSIAVSQEMKLLQPSLDNYLGPSESYEEMEDECQEYEEYDEYDEYDEYEYQRSPWIHGVFQYMSTAVSDELKDLQPRLNDYLHQ